MAQSIAPILLLIVGVSLMAGSYMYLNNKDEVTQLTKLDKSFTANFKTWLTSNGYSTYKFDRPDLVGSSYGYILSYINNLKVVMKPTQLESQLETQLFSSTEIPILV
jgi:hypothetical protein